jgi:hypothetical protein
LQESRRLPNHPLYASTTVRWEENYSLSPIEMDLPDEGSEQSDLKCPVCSEGLRLKLVSVKRIQTLLTCPWRSWPWSSAGWAWY